MRKSNKQTQTEYQIKNDYVTSSPVTHWTAVLNHNFEVPRFVRNLVPIGLAFVAPVLVVFIGVLFEV